MEILDFELDAWTEGILGCLCLGSGYIHAPWDLVENVSWNLFSFHLSKKGHVGKPRWCAAVNTVICSASVHQQQPPSASAQDFDSWMTKSVTLNVLPGPQPAHVLGPGGLGVPPLPAVLCSQISRAAPWLRSGLCSSVSALTSSSELLPTMLVTPCRIAQCYPSIQHISLPEIMYLFLIVTVYVCVCVCENVLSSRAHILCLVHYFISRDQNSILLAQVSADSC